MPKKTKDSNRSFTTRFSLLFMNLVSEPFMALYTLLIFILRKDLGATTFQISVFVTLRPIMSVFSFYWSANLLRQRNKLLPNLMGAWVLGRLPFLCFPLIENVWFLIFSAAIYQIFYRAGIPAMMEILKLNVEKESREKLFSLVYVLGFIESILLGFFIGKILDVHVGSWKILFFVTSLLSISSIFIQMRIPMPTLSQDPTVLPVTTNRFLQPWKDSIHLMRSRPDFAHFQWGFMIGGFGLMLIAPALVIYYTEVISLTHHDFTIARYIWMGAGVILSSFLWRKSLATIPLHRITSLIILGFAFFPLVLLLAPLNLLWVDIAFFIYGIAQAGSHLIWNLSGTLFSKPHEDSSKFSAINILMVGVRGTIAPVLGGILCEWTHPLVVLISGTTICMAGSFYMLVRSPKWVETT